MRQIRGQCSKNRRTLHIQSEKSFGHILFTLVAAGFQLFFQKPDPEQPRHRTGNGTFQYHGQSPARQADSEQHRVCRRQKARKPLLFLRPGRAAVILIARYSTAAQNFRLQDKGIVFCNKAKRFPTGTVFVSSFGIIFS